MTLKGVYTSRALKHFSCPNITFDSKVIIPSDCDKSLGVILDSKLGFT